MPLNHSACEEYTSPATFMYSDRTSIANQRSQQRRTIDLGPHAPIEVVNRRRLARGHLGHHVRDRHLIIAFIVIQKTRQMKHVAAREADEELRVCKKPTEVSVQDVEFRRGGGAGRPHRRRQTVCRSRDNGPV